MFYKMDLADEMETLQIKPTPKTYKIKVGPKTGMSKVPVVSTPQLNVAAVTTATSTMITNVSTSVAPAKTISSTRSISGRDALSYLTGTGTNTNIGPSGREEYEEANEKVEDLEFYLKERAGEDSDSYRIRRLYATTAKEQYKDQISASKAASIGQMVVNKIRYGVTYSPSYEEVIAVLSEYI